MEGVGLAAERRNFVSAIKCINNILEAGAIPYLPQLEGLIQQQFPS